MKMDKETEEETSKKRTREAEKDENETMRAKEDVSIRFLRRPLMFLVKIGRIVDLSDRDPENLDGCVRGA